MCNFSCELGADLQQEPARLFELAADGLVELEPNRVRVTERGRRFVRNVAMVFDAHLDPSATHARAV